jgi:hypothetical protein
MSPQDKLRAYWSNSNTEIKPIGSPEADVARLEARTGVRLPDDFRTYLLTNVPSGRDALDDNMTGWWNAGEIKSIVEEYPHELKNPVVAEDPGHFLVFADYCLWCWAWAIGCGDGEHRGKVALIGGENDRFVADSFDAFVELYVADPNAVD